MMRPMCAALAVAVLAMAGAANAQGEAAPLEAPAAVETQAGPAAITAAPINVTLRRTGNASAFRAQPRIGLAGYNIAAFITSRVTASSGGSLFGGGLGARARMDFNLAGVDRALLQRIADAAHADLVAQLAAAGIEVAPADQIFANGAGANLLAPNGFYETEEPGTQSELFVTGPNGIGAVQHQGVGRTSIGAGGVPALSHANEAVLLFPNLVLDFVETSGSGNRSLGNRANVGGEARFAVDPMSVVQVQFSRSGRFLDGWATLQTPEAFGVDDEFAVTEQISESNNNAAAAISAVLGAAMQASRREGYLVTADPAEYEALALRAARGFNAAIVEQVLQARSR